MAEVPDASASNRFAGLRRFSGPVALAALFAALAACEADIATLPFTFICAALLACVAFALTRRARFAIFIGGALMALSAVASMAKYRFLAVNAHVFDIWFYLSRPDTVAFLGDEYFRVIITAAFALAAFVALAALVYRHDGRRLTGRREAIGCSLALAALLPAALPREAGEFAYHIRKNHFASSFFVSLSDIGRLSGPDPLARKLAKAPEAPPFTPAAACDPAARPPDIFLVLDESAVPPSRVPGWRFDPGIEDHMRSYDGVIHAARVETHGGGTWITHASVLSGLSMADFGWMRPYVTMMLRGRLHHSLPLALAACGYRTMMISPQSFNFVNEGPLLKSLGIQDYIDRASLMAPTKHEPDSFYFARALEYYKAHLREDGRPLFMFIMTMTAHAPYFDRFEPGRVARGEPFGNDAETDEYLRRLTFAQEDYTAFIDGVSATRGERPALVAEFGDHHPENTRKAFEAAGAVDPIKDFGSPIYKTFYAMTPLGFRPNVPLPDVEALDVAYLGVTLLETAGLPLDPAYAEQKALRDHCGGAFHLCVDRASVDRHLLRMAKSGQIDEPGAGPATAVAEAEADGGAR